ncbi:hypothetical protein BASA81_006501 [Batrachochytrium salamandrivorans]|nr:hypothetical protein BASA81_006501 [Batrachochytrium salamandrivorans]
MDGSRSQQAEHQALLLRRRLLVEMSDEEDGENAFEDYLYKFKLQSQQVDVSRQVLLWMVVVVPALSILLVHWLSSQSVSV